MIGLDMVSENALLVDFSHVDDTLRLTQIGQFSDGLRGHPRLLDVIAAPTSVLLIGTINSAPTRLFELAHGHLAALGNASLSEPPLTEIPVCYDPEFGPDLTFIAEQANLSVEAVIKLHSEGEYQVSAIGFSPGFPYLKGLPKALQLPRRASPRTRVPKGSVAIAADMSAVYPNPSPGGWHLVGRTPMAFFEPSREPMCPVAVGSRVQFKPMTRQAFDDWLPSVQSSIPQPAPQTTAGDKP
jgi:KipI family sensor histidine kinase inhibitor